MQGTDAAQRPASDRGWRLFFNGSALLKRALPFRSQRFFYATQLSKARDNGLSKEGSPRNNTGKPVVFRAKDPFLADKRASSKQITLRDGGVVTPVRDSGTCGSDSRSDGC